MALVQEAVHEVAVIGAGPASLAVAAASTQLGFSAVVVDKADAVGSTWRSHYERLRLHTERALSGLPGMAIPRKHGKWVPRAGGDVLVVGTGNSGAEIAVDLADGGARRVRVAVRTPPNILRRELLGISSQRLGVLLRHAPVAIVDPIASALARLTVGDLTRYGLPPAQRQPPRDRARRAPDRQGFAGRAVDSVAARCKLPAWSGSGRCVRPSAQSFCRAPRPHARSPSASPSPRRTSRATSSIWRSRFARGGNGSSSSRRAASPADTLSCGVPG
jgi:cation diffusion facilitator CzcD-associated flavoprotein CzcO